MLDIASAWILICSFVLFFMQAGFLCLEAGRSRANNASHVALKNLADLSVVVLVFWLAGLGLMQWPPRMVVAGINRGENMGQDITYSGTVTAALEATIHGVPALAVSLADREANDVADYQLAAQMAVKIARRILEKGLPPFTILSLNLPPGNGVKGLRLTRQGVRIYRDELARNGNVMQIVGAPPTGVKTEEGTDLWALHNGYASLTPIHLDMTAHRFLADLAAWDIDVI